MKPICGFVFGFSFLQPLFLASGDHLTHFLDLDFGVDCLESGLEGLAFGLFALRGVDFRLFLAAFVFFILFEAFVAPRAPFSFFSYIVNPFIDKFIKFVGVRMMFCGKCFLNLFSNGDIVHLCIECVYQIVDHYFFTESFQLS